MSGLMASSDNVGSYDMQGVCDLIVSLVDNLAPEPSLLTFQNTLRNENNEHVLNNLLEVSLDCYKSMHPLKKERKILLTMLLKITDPDHRHICR